jgi:hypothetical protein
MKESQTTRCEIMAASKDNGEEKEELRNEAINSENNLPTSSRRSKREPRPSTKQES